MANKRYHATMRTLLLVLLVLAGAAPAADVPLYGRFETTLTSLAPDGDLIEVYFVAPSKEVFWRDGFRDTGNAYRVRMIPTEEGQWSWTVSRGPEGVKGKTGQFTVKRDAATTNRFLKHGPLQVSKDGYYLQHLDGTPLFFLADTCWNGPLLSKPDHWETYLKDRVEKRFTAIQFVMLSPWRTAPSNAEGQVAFRVDAAGKMEILPEFYGRIDQRMDSIEKQGLLSVPVLMWAWGKKDAGQTLSDDDAARIIRYQVARYGAHPVLWILNGDGNYTGATAEKWKRIGNKVFHPQPSDPRFRPAHQAPVTLHPGGSKWPYNDFSDELWLKVWGYQSSHSASDGNFKWICTGPASQNWAKFPRVYINLEPPYEDHIAGGTKVRFDAHAVRRASYWSILIAPPAGITYGGHGIWSWQEVAAPPFDHPYTGIAKPWQEAKDLPGATSMKHLAALMSGIEWWKLRPAPQLLAKQPGADAPSKFIAVAQHEKLILAYTPVAQTIELKAAGNGRWFDPRTGGSTEAKSDAGKFTPPGEGDWVLIVQ